MGYIYKITNKINGKLYIGQTTLFPPEKRWKEHKNNINKKQYNNYPLYKALKKYGIENFIFEVIEEINNTDLDEKEQYYIDKYRTYVGFKNCNGYNATLGGEGTRYIVINDDIKAEIISYHITISLYDLKITCENFKYNKNIIKGILRENNIHWLSNSSKNKIKKYIKNGAVIQVDPTNTYIINMFATITEAGEYIGITGKKNYSIEYACSNKTHKAYGFYWYKEEDLPDSIIKDNRLYNNEFTKEYCIEYINKINAEQKKNRKEINKKETNKKETKRNNIISEPYIEGEEWRGLKYRGENLSWRFEISNYGRIRNALNKHIYIPHKGGIGYYQICTCVNKKNKNIKIHRAVAENFIPNPNNLTDIIHINNNLKDNYVDNLKWVSHKEVNNKKYKNKI